ncbi:MAG: hypothetical protein AAFW88_13835, partial [Pseudomonadota bacterium]
MLRKHVSRHKLRVTVSRLRLINARIATMAASAGPYGLIEHGFVDMSDGYIRDVGEMDQAPATNVPKRDLEG